MTTSPTSLRLLINTLCPAHEAPPMEGIIWLRVAEFFEDLPEVPLELAQPISEALAAAYRQGLQDGVHPLGMLTELDPVSSVAELVYTYSAANQV